MHRQRDAIPAAISNGCEFDTITAAATIGTTCCLASLCPPALPPQNRDGDMPDEHAAKWQKCDSRPRNIVGQSVASEITEECRRQCQKQKAAEYGRDDRIAKPIPEVRDRIEVFGARVPIPRLASGYSASRSTETTNTAIPTSPQGNSSQCQSDDRPRSPPIMSRTSMTPAAPAPRVTWTPNHAWDAQGPFRRSSRTRSGGQNGLAELSAQQPAAKQNDSERKVQQQGEKEIDTQPIANDRLS